MGTCIIQQREHQGVLKASDTVEQEEMTKLSGVQGHSKSALAFMNTQQNQTPQKEKIHIVSSFPATHYLNIVTIQHLGQQQC